VDIARVFDAFVSEDAASPEIYYATLSNPLQVAKTAIYGILTLIADGFLVRLTYSPRLFALMSFHSYIGCSWFGIAGS
jgi:hypothetical protein